MKLCHLAAHAYADGALPEPVLVQLFQKGLEDIDTQRFVGLQEPSTLEEAVRHASAFEAYGAKGSWRKPRSVNSVTERGTDSNLASELADLKLKYEQLQKQLQKPKVGLKPGSCHFCQQPGHWANSCPQRSQNRQYNAPPHNQGPWQQRPSHQGYGQPPTAAAVETQPGVAGSMAPEQPVAPLYPELQNSLNY
jgi:hypothetical protein